jgi:hypothetical protein
MKGNAMLRPTAIATLISGSLDILFAMILTLIIGKRTVAEMLRDRPFADD